MNIKSLTYAAISISLIFMSFILFRGAANIVNSIIVPVVFYINYTKFNLKEYLLLILAVFILSFLFFFQQLFFIIFYAVLGWLLYYTLKRKLGFIVNTIIISIAFLIGFVSTISLTDLIIGTALRKALLTVGGGSQLGLILVFIMISIVVGLTLDFIIFELDKRLKGEVLINS